MLTRNEREVMMWLAGRKACDFSEDMKDRICKSLVKRGLAEDVYEDDQPTTLLTEEGEEALREPATLWNTK